MYYHDYLPDLAAAIMRDRLNRTEQRGSTYVPIPQTSGRPAPDCRRQNTSGAAIQAHSPSGAARIRRLRFGWRGRMSRMIRGRRPGRAPFGARFDEMRSRRGGELPGEDGAQSSTAAIEEDEWAPTA